MVGSPFEETAPTDQGLTAYDREHMGDYLRVLDAHAAEADWSEIAQIIFKLDPTAQPERCKAIVQSHLERAKWLSAQGYAELARDDRPV